jgi:hypothetical protein
MIKLNVNVAGGREIGTPKSYVLPSQVQRDVHLLADNGILHPIDLAGVAKY